jgi:hypothetical protein
MLGKIDIISKAQSGREIIFNNVYGSDEIQYGDYNGLYIAYEELIYPWENKDIKDAMYSSSSSS